MNDLRSRLEQIRINQTGKIVDPIQAAKAIGQDTDIGMGADFKLDANFGAKLTQKFDAIKKHELETVPRETVLLMLTEKKLDEYFTFKVEKNEGENYVQAMRQILSRTRKKALRRKTPLNEFKLLTVSINSLEDHDVVTLVRTRQMSEHDQSVYDVLIAAIEKKPMLVVK